MLRRLHPRCSLWLNAALALVCAAVFLLVLLWPLHSLGTTVAYTPEERSLLEALESGEIIRLHVLADGDDAESQRVKLCVRDALIAAFGEMLLGASQADADTVYETLLTHVSQMEEAALACARENGFTGSVTAEAGGADASGQNLRTGHAAGGRLPRSAGNAGQRAGAKLVVRAVSPAVPGGFLRGVWKHSPPRCPT